MSLRIGLDVRMIQNTGIGTYLRGLLSGLLNSKVPEPWEFSLWGDSDPAAAAAQKWPRKSFDAPIYSPKEQWLYPGILRQTDLWHAPHYNIPLDKGRAKLVVTVHDLIHWIYRKDFFTPFQAFYAQTFFQKTAAQADQIIAVSKRTKEDFVRYFQADPQKITVIHEAVSPFYQPGEDAALWESLTENTGLKTTFFLYVGSLKPHKNVSTLLRVFGSLRKSKQTEAALVIVGKKDSRYAPEFRDLAALETGNGIYHLPDLSQKQVLELYRRALALVHPSLYEGFGLTPLEAMACGTPVICSNAASLPEVAGDAAMLVDPLDTKSMAGAMNRVETQSDLRLAMREKGFRQIKKFSWDETARQTLDVYRKAFA